MSAGEPAPREFSVYLSLLIPVKFHRGTDVGAQLFETITPRMKQEGYEERTGDFSMLSIGGATK